MSTRYIRQYAGVLTRRLEEPRRFIQVVTGARQVGKTTLVLQVTGRSDLSSHYASADQPTLRSENWIEQQWEVARIQEQKSERPTVLILDEIQKVTYWSEVVKRLWDEDTRAGKTLHVVLLGSAPLLVQKGLTESLAGRFERIHLPHWSYSEMREAFDFSLEKYVYFGSYPGAAQLISEPDRWRRYILDSLIETTLSRDVLLLSRVHKPALLRRLFELGVTYSGRELSFTKMIGQLQDAGNTTTLAHYLDLLSDSGMLAGIQKYAGDTARRRSSSPKLQVYNTALMTAVGGFDFDIIRNNPEKWGRHIESTVGAHLINAESMGLCKIFYWRHRNMEVDFVVQSSDGLAAIEVKSSSRKRHVNGLNEFEKSFGDVRKILVGGDGIPLDDFLQLPINSWN